MNLLNSIKIIVFDFDGVIIDSMEVRDLGFRKIFENYPSEKVEKLIEYHRINGGLSRFHKIDYFYKQILGNDINTEKIYLYSNEFSNIMREELVKEKYIITEWIEFIKENNDKYIMHIASGSEEKELRYICDKLGISKYFKSIHGSPIHKNELVRSIMKDNSYNKDEVVMIGDSINDYEAADVNQIKFIGYNNKNLQGVGDYYLESFIVSI